MPYSEVSIVGYNANPPEDDGTQASSNEVSWGKHKDKLGDPLKTAIESTQTNITTAVTAIEADLIEAGTKMLFQQTSAPTGWTKDTTHNDKAIRIVSGTASSGGSTAFSSVLTSRTILQANLPSYNLSHSLTAADHVHGYTASDANVQINNGTGNTVQAGDSIGSETTAGSGSLAVSGTISSGGSGTAMDFDINYVDAIIATKD